MRENGISVVELITKSGRKLYTLLYRISLRTDVAEDLLQDLAVRLLKSPGFRSAKSPEAFAVRTAQRLAFDWLREQKRSGAAYSRAARHDGDDWSEEAAERLERDDDFARVLAALGELSEAQRECIVLRFLQGEEHDAIANMTGSTPHRVRATISKGIRRLQLLLVTETDQVNSTVEGDAI